MDYKKKKKRTTTFRDNDGVTVEDNATIRTEVAGEGPADEEKRIEGRRMRENDGEREERKEKERCDERQRTGTVVADAIRR